MMSYVVPEPPYSLLLLTYIIFNKYDKNISDYNKISLLLKLKNYYTDNEFKCLMDKLIQKYINTIPPITFADVMNNLTQA